VTSGGVPVNALLLMAIPSVVVSAFYAFSPTFVQLTYDATLVIAMMFFVTGLAFVFMPIRAKAIWQNSALPKGPILPIVGIIYVLFMGGMLIAWFYDKLNVYGVGYKNKNSMIFMAILYVAAIVIWVIAYFVRKNQGMELEAVAKEIPVE
jgi:amino acid transporter